MNLITDKWIPVLRRNDNKREIISPAEITDEIDKNPYLLLDAPRPDFNGALLQFFIGLLQTAMTPDNEDEWQGLFLNPPSPDELAKKFKSFEPNFNLAGEKPLFMQDYNLLAETDIKEWSIFHLLIDISGGDHNQYFNKTENLHYMCPNCAAMALFTYQTNAPSGGSGHRTSIRGGGPLSTFVFPDKTSQQYDTFWHRAWLNVLEKMDLSSTGCNVKNNKIELQMPWIAPTRTSGEKDSPVFGKEIHPNQIYWSMPRRIVLNKIDSENEFCSLCGNVTDSLYSTFFTKKHGIEYGAGIVHPLSPYRDKDGNLIPLHPQNGGFTYQYWPDFLFSTRRNSKGNQRALVVQKADKRWQSFNTDKINLTLSYFALGYDIYNNVKARCWYETQIPFFEIREENEDKRNKITEFLENTARELADSARVIASNTKQAVKNAWFSPNASVRGDFSFVENEFWQATESEYTSILRIAAGGKYTKTEEFYNELEPWLKKLHKESLALFDRYADQVPLDQGKPGEPPRFLQARKKLQVFNQSDKTREVIGLPARKADKQKIKRRK